LFTQYYPACNGVFIHGTVTLAALRGVQVCRITRHSGRHQCYDLLHCNAAGVTWQNLERACAGTAQAIRHAATIDFNENKKPV
jgi:hypothetical protein